MRDDGTGDDGAPERDLRDRNTVSKKAQTAVHIAAMRKGGLSGYKLQEEDQVYSDEDDEQAEAREKRERDDDWLVGEDGSTYRDDGDDAGDYSDLDEDAPERRKAKGPVKKGAFNQLAPQRKAIKTVGGKAGKAPVFVSGARGGAGGAREGGAAPVLSARAADKAVMQSDMLDSILGDIGGSIGGFAAGSLHSGGILGSSVPGAARPVRSAREQLIAGKNVTGASRAPAPRQQRRPVALARPAVRSAFEGRLPPLGAEAEEEYAHEGGAEADWQGDDGAAEINDEGGGAGGDTDEVMDDAPAKSAAELAKPFSAQLESGAGGGEDWFTVTAEAPVDAEAEAPTPPLPAAGMSGGAPPLPPLEADGSMRFYFLDAYEDVYNQPGVVFLFGKAATGQTSPKGDPLFESVCVTLKGLTRHLLVCPREKHDMNEVYAEVATLLRKHGVSAFKCKPVTRKYAFDEPGVPSEGEFLEVIYDGATRSLPTGISGESFLIAFGAGTSQTEHLLIQQRIQGPCWLTVSGVQPVQSACSWCRFEAIAKGRETVTVLKASEGFPVPPAPPLRVMAIRVHTVLADDKAKSHHVVLASAIVHDGIRLDGADASAALASRPRPAAHGGGGLSHFSVVRRLDDQIWPWDLEQKIEDSKMPLERAPNERALLQFLLAKIHTADPDVLVGHNISGFDLQVLLQRMSAHAIPHWSKLCRLKRSKQPSSGANSGTAGKDGYLDWSVVCGRLLADTYLCARELLLGQRSYALRELAATQLNVMGKEDVDPASIRERLRASDSLLHLVRCAENDAFLSLRLLDKLQVLPLTRQLTTIAGNLWSHSLKGQRAERIEFLLLHEFNRLGYVVPDKLSQKEREATVKRRGKNAAAAQRLADGDGDDYGDEDDAPAEGAEAGGNGRKKPAYAGGLVLEPKRGLYDHYVLLLDFNSLYPSIVQEYNLCFTTVEIPVPLPDGTVPPPMLPEQGFSAPGVLPVLIKGIVDRRRDVKKLLAKETDPARRSQHDTRQKALKIMANSMYGCLGFKGSRFYARPIAELICTAGRASLQRTVEVAEGQGLEVIYGDTDSIMIHSRTKSLAEARGMAVGLKKEVNRLYKCLEIEVDGVFEMMLLLKKKKYAALVVEGEENGVATKWSRETKGLDLVRRDWCLLSRDVGSKVLDLLLSARPRDEIVEAVHEYLRAVAAAVRANQLPIEQYAISKGLTKSPADYPDARNQAHVQVALQLLARGEAVAPGSVIEYVVCEYKPDAAAGATSTAQGQADGDGASIGTPPAAKREPKPSVAPVGKSIAERARHPSAVLAADGALSVDREWYLANQIHPPVARLLDVIEGTDSARIAECLGLDPSKFSGGQSGAVAAEGVDEIFGNAVEDDEARFRDVSPLTLACAACGESAHARPLTSAVPAVDGKHPALACAACGEPYDGVLLHNQLTVAMRRAEKTYYTSELVCEEASCGEVSRCLSAFISTDENGQPLFPACVAPRCRAHMVARHTARELHTQLLYLERLFDCAYAQRRAERAHRRQPESQPTWTPMCKADKEFCEELVAHVRSRLADCAYHSVNVGKLCALVRGSVPSQATLGIAPVV